MKLYEVIFNGVSGREDDADAVYLVRAEDFKAAIEEVANNASKKHHHPSAPLPHVVYEIGEDLSYGAENHPLILRGPYFQSAYNRGWRAWYRKVEGAGYTNEWEEERRDGHN